MNFAKVKIFLLFFFFEIFLLFFNRLAPAYFFILWFQTSAVLRLGSGPLWNIIAKQENDFCVSNWWTNVLFINNYVNSDKIVSFYYL